MRDTGGRERETLESVHSMLSNLLCQVGLLSDSRAWRSSAIAASTSRSGSDACSCRRRSMCWDSSSRGVVFTVLAYVGAGWCSVAVVLVAVRDRGKGEEGGQSDWPHAAGGLSHSEVRNGNAHPLSLSMRPILDDDAVLGVVLGCECSRRRRREGKREREAKDTKHL